MSEGKPMVALGYKDQVWATWATPVPKDAERHWDVNLILFIGRLNCEKACLPIIDRNKGILIRNA